MKINETSLSITLGNNGYAFARPAELKICIKVKKSIFDSFHIGNRMSK